ncbi:ABC transporter ATP-binding protein [Paenibacillus sp. SC116]|uniref:ABC transporter ATP-binding protein n=1 Tax=Paenibacillus sp. SC116 TaxID=2968986 RepID=UPI00215A49EB|nr:ABC transporter ATP-binding protein [Paenibacillus sp. SC116]MCR8845708.1 ABC transporter ATP-binding protein [Paenibacillus sp. SC116]
MSVIEVSNLYKSFGPVHAVKGISFSVKAGEIFTIIGPNGAGKTTTLEMIEGLLQPDKGSVQLFGLSWPSHAEKLKERIGVQLQTSAMFDLLTVEEHLDVFRSFYKRKRQVSDILTLVNLQEQRKQRIKGLSGGQKQRLAIGLALINDPEVIFLDEPTTGLDPQARRNIWDIILNLKELGKTVILTTHYMEEAERLSSRVCIVDQGQIVALDTSKALIQQISTEREISIQGIKVEHVQDMAIFADKIHSVKRVETDGVQLQVLSTSPEQTLLELFHYTTACNYKVEQINIRDWSLEDVFIALTGKEWRD